MFKGLLSAVVAVSCAANAVAATTATIELVSRAADASTASANGASLGPVYSPDGTWVLFSSTAADLVNLAGNNHFQAYAVNTTNGAVDVLSMAAGKYANDGVFAPAMGHEAKYGNLVVFQSAASNLSGLVQGDNNGQSDIFLYYKDNGRTRALTQGNDVSEFPEISDDGIWVAFLSNATNLVTNDTNSFRDVFVINGAGDGGPTRLASVGWNGSSMNAEVTDFSLLPSGRFILFAATGTNLVVPGRGSGGDVYLRDALLNTTRWVSRAVTNLAGFSSNSASSAVISTNGRYVAMVAAPASPNKPALVRVDLNDDSVDVLTNNAAASLTGGWFGPSISDDGEFVAYSNGTNVFYWSASTGETVRVDVTASGAAPNGLSDQPEISHDGKKVAFMSTSSDLVEGVGNGEPQIYVRDMVSGATRLVTLSISGEATIGNEVATFSFRRDDAALVFDSRADDLVAMDNNEDYDVFAWNLATGNVGLVSQSKAAAPSLTGNGRSNVGRYSISADGRYVAMNSFAQLSTKDTNATFDAYVYDRVLKTNILVSAGPDGFSKAGIFNLPMISANGKKVVFESASPGLAGVDDTRTGTSIYVRDLETGTLVNISGANVGSLSALRISDDGRYVIFATGTQLHQYDLVNGTDVSEIPPTGSIPSALGSPLGTGVAFADAANLWYRDFSIPVRVRLGATATPVLFTAEGELIYTRTTSISVTNVLTGETNVYPGIAAPRSLSISGDGNIIVYQTRTVVGGPWEIWYLDRTTGQTNFVSKAMGSQTSGNGDSTAPSISADGRFIAFESWATDLVANDTNAIKDIFVFDRTSGEISLVSHAAGSAGPSNSGSFNPLFAPSGPLLVFISNSTDLISGDLNDDIDVFAAVLDTGVSLSDTDGDGLNDNWEIAAFSTLAYGANDDPDGDGATNREEFLAGTNANSPTSILEALSIEVGADGSATLTFSSVQGKKYRVEFTASLTAPQWTTVGGEVSASATGQTTVNIPSAGEGYYRLRLVE
ncbi:MAG TPA: hypothetical protein VM680_00360 [Verrucomicrobiae bacterium]|nr:hypothetical protein [Verrucomicrobiae bacterium]